MVPRAVAALVAVLAAAGCAGPPVSRSSTVPSPATASAPTRRSTGWTVTVYYTAVEAYHSGAPTRVTGCPTIDCTRGDADLGAYPADFLRAVRDEGTGRTRSGRYLNWSADTGYWLDSAPRDSYGGVLRPFRSAAADPDVLPRGTGFTIADCGHAEDGGPVPVPVCGRLRAAHWTVSDEFTPGLGGVRHVDAYLGEETGPRFTGTDWYVTLAGAALTLGA